MQAAWVRLLAAWAAAIIVAPAAVDAAVGQCDRNDGRREIAGQSVQSERDEQESLFDFYFQDRGLRYETRLDELKMEAAVPGWRIPYSAAIHPETSGGLSDSRAARTTGLFRRNRGVATVSRGSSPLSIYDRAFHGGQDMANAYEIRRIGSPRRATLFAARTRSSSESWEGYCSGFTASTILHPEPLRSVDAGDVGGRAGVVFRPADIKALLSCVYNRTTPDSYLYLAPPSGRDGGPNMGTFHLALANYIGQAGQPVGLDRTKGQVAWNNPVYAYEVRSIRDAGQADGTSYHDVETTVTYSDYGSDAELQTDLDSGRVAGNRRRTTTFRYTLAVDDQGRIAGGRPRGPSGHFLWIPLHAVQATQDGSVPGNPYVDVETVLALAKASADPGLQAKYDEAVMEKRD